MSVCVENGTPNGSGRYNGLTLERMNGNNAAMTAKFGLNGDGCEGEYVVRFLLCEIFVCCLVSKVLFICNVLV